MPPQPCTSSQKGPTGAPWWQVSWSVPAAVRALRATIVIPCLLALTFKVLHSEQMAVFAVFGGFGTLVLASFGGTRRDKALAHLGLSAGECAIVGDRLETDIVMGKRLGLATVLVLTGITQADDPLLSEIAPDLIVPSLRDLLR